jgi:putative ABC transport system substrate-binding protein
MEQTLSLKFMVTALLAAILVTLPGVSQVFGQPSNARIGVLTPGLTFASIHAGLQEGLARLGYKEGQNITFIVEDTMGSSVGLSPRVAKLLAAKPDMLFTVTTIHSLAAKRATTTVPIVFAWASDPVAAGLIASYASSKNNLTGVTNLDASLSGKRLEVFLELAPKVKRLLVLVASMQSAGLIALPFLETTAKKLGVQLVRRVVANREEIIRALGEFPKGSVDAIYYIPSALMRTNIDLLIEKAKSDRIPMAVLDELLVERGALFSYGPSARLIGLQAASLVDKVLKGTKPSEIVVETPNRFFLTINLATAKRIGLKVPRAILDRADRLIE